MSGQQLRIRGLVQGVGFRPYVWHLARSLGLRGWVRNDAEGVTLAVAGQQLEAFLTRLPLEIPPLARIDGIETQAVWVEGTDFQILESRTGPVMSTIGPDTQVCADCLADICDPHGAYWRYPLTSCTHCGPRYTVSLGLPYDRARTSLAPFPLCLACQQAYDNPADRRFHAETTACPVCGPQLFFWDAHGQSLIGDPLGLTLQQLKLGKIVAIKGLGGFHLVCDARNAGAVARLRHRKAREAKPFAVMGLNVASLTEVAQIGAAEAALLHAVAGPIVLCPKGSIELPGVAPGLAELGVMLPTTPLHVLLWHEALGQPIGTDWLKTPSELLWVMTSANPQGEPLVTGNAEAVERLAGIADAFLVHDREIVMRCDDSVMRSGPTFLRRSRGYVPQPIPLAEAGPPVLAVGAYLKNTVCVTRGEGAFLSQHIGSLDNVATLGFLHDTVHHLLDMLEVQPLAIAHDLHPDFPSTRFAEAFAVERGIPAYGVAHHHAHIAALCAEHHIAGPVLGLALDGFGLGPASAGGGAWGGECLRIAGVDCQRLGHLQTLKLPGGDKAAHEPWRMGISALHGAGMTEAVSGWLRRTYPKRQSAPLLQLLDADLRCPPTSSLGRWFDAAAALLGVCEVSAYEGQAAMLLEALARRHGPVTAPPGTYQITGTVLDFSPVLPRLLTCQDATYGAALFHATVAAGLSEWALSFMDASVRQLLVSGGCALNTVLIRALEKHLSEAGIRLIQAQQVPPNDAGLALGQAWVVHQQWKEKVPCV